MTPDLAPVPAADATASPSTTAPVAAPASAFSIRRLRVDLARGFGPLWAGGDAFRTHFMNALSMSFPVGEQFFIDSVRAGVQLRPAEDQARWAPLVRGFVGQEATHRHLHGLFNAELARQGLVNHWERWARWRIARSARMHPVNHVAVTAAYEHFTAVLATDVLQHPSRLAGAEPDLALLWRWHAVEESEHKAVAFDLYREMGGSERRRIAWFAYIWLLFVLESLAQTTINLWNSGQLRRPRTWGQGLRFLFGRQGLVWTTARPLMQYLRPGFHPRQLPDAPAVSAWLQEHQGRYAVVGE